MKKLILASTSTLHGETYLNYLLTPLVSFFDTVKTITFIAYARPGGISYQQYTTSVQKAFEQIEKEVIGLHTYEDAVQGIQEAEAIFTGGGNTFLLVDQLYQQQLISPLRDRILAGTPYLGTSAGSNIAGPTMQTTNDMPIVYPPSFTTLGLVNFNINAHYLDPDPKSTHNGETRETRIREFHQYNTTPVVGLREGSYIHITENTTVLKGKHSARIFEQGKSPYESHKLYF